MSKAIISTELVETINSVEVKFNLADSGFMMNSLDIARVFSKKPKHIIEKIEKISRFDNLLTGSKIRLSQYKDGSGKSNKMYLLDRDVFSFVVMGFTGEKAEEWKWSYIDAFNKMEQLLKDKTTPLNSAERYELEQFRASEEISGEFMEDAENGHSKIKRVKGYWRTDKRSKVDHQAEKLKELNEQIKKGKEKLGGLLDAEIVQLIEKKITEKNELMSSF